MISHSILNIQAKMHTNLVTATHIHKFQRRAFTLAEVGVVLAITGILAAILFPILSRARASARTSTCAANLRQIGQALALYKSNNDGFYPPAVTIEPPNGSGSKRKAASIWWANIGLQSPPVCPEIDFSVIATKPKFRHLRGSYASNYNLTNFSGSDEKPKLSGKVEFVLLYPSLTVVALDARQFFYALSSPDTARTVGELNGFLCNKGARDRILKLPPGATRHQGGANYLFGDGHVKWYRPEQLSTTPKNDGVHPGFGL